MTQRVIFPGLLESEGSMIDFNQRARNWDLDPMKVERARIVAEAIRSAVPLAPGIRALEYGCGTGLLSFYLQPYLDSITLVDTSPGMLEVLAGKIKAAGVMNMFPIHLNLSVDPLPATRFHLIFSLMALHHTHDIDGLLRKFHLLLELGGVLCIADVDKEDGSFHGAEVTDVHHGFERRDLQLLVEGVGFRKVRYSTVFEIQKLVDKVERNYPLFLMIAEKEA
jgi:ubiquinone/menaquinone biosynthesis C-methylase UbiE